MLNYQRVPFKMPGGAKRCAIVIGKNGERKRIYWDVEATIHFDHFGDNLEEPPLDNKGSQVT